MTESADKIKEEFAKGMEEYQKQKEGIQSSPTGTIEEVSAVSEEKVTEQEVPSNLSAVEQEQVKLGWKPDGEFSADEFKRRGELFQKISTQNKQIKELKDGLKNLTEHLTNTQRAAKEKVIKELQEERDSAVAEADVVKFREAEAKLAETIKQPELAPITEIVEENPETVKFVKDFFEKNKGWCNEETPENREMKEAAELIDAFLAKKAHESGKTLAVPEHLQLVEERVRALYPHRFENPKQNAPAAVGRPTTSGDIKTSTASLVGRLTPQQLQIGKEFARLSKNSGGKYTLEQYAKELDLQGSLNK